MIKKLFRVFLKIFLVVSVIFIVAAVFLFVYVIRITKDLPDYRELAEYEPPVMSRVHASDGELIAEFAQQHRIYVPVSSIPEKLIAAFISAEDKNFYHHKGIYLPGILRAAVSNIKNIATGRRLVGGSTITQQVAKNFLLTNERSLNRKIREIFITRRIEQAYTKDRILELYLNEIYLGRRAYGIAAASLNYFNKSLDALTLSEMAFLAALPKGPYNYEPEHNMDKAIARRNWVLRQMENNDYITKEDAENAMAQPLLSQRRLQGSKYIAAEYFVEEVRRRVVTLYGKEALYDGGLSIRSTLDTRMQISAQKALQSGLQVYDKRHGWRGAMNKIPLDDQWAEHLGNVKAVSGVEGWRLAVVLAYRAGDIEIGFKDGQKGLLPEGGYAWAYPKSRTHKKKTALNPKKFLAKGDIIFVEPIKKDSGGSSKSVLEYKLQQVPKVNGALVALDPHTGRILALAGGYSFKLSQFNRATQAKRQPGSAFKPFVYAAALDHGYTPVSKILDAPFVKESGGKVYTPKNYSSRYYGLSTLRLGLEKSRNVMTVRLANDIGLDPVIDYGTRFGIYDTLIPVPSIALGSAETTLLRVVQAYGALVNNGKSVTPTVIDRIQNRWGKTIYVHDKRACETCKNLVWEEALSPPVLENNQKEIIDPITAFQTVWMLKGVVDRGTGRIVRSVHKPLAGKTGTTNDYKDAWFVGFSPDLVAGVYIGYDRATSLGQGESGGRVAAPIFRDFMKEALQDKSDQPFRVPSGIRFVPIDAKTGDLSVIGTSGSILEAFRPGTEPGSNLLENSGSGDLGLEALISSQDTPVEYNKESPLNPEDRRLQKKNRNSNSLDKKLKSVPLIKGKKKAKKVKENTGNEELGGIY